MFRAKKFIYSKRFEGLPKLTDFELVVEELPELLDGGCYYHLTILKYEGKNP